MTLKLGNSKISKITYDGKVISKITYDNKVIYTSKKVKIIMKKGPQEQIIAEIYDEDTNTLITETITLKLAKNSDSNIIETQTTTTGAAIFNQYIFNLTNNKIRCIFDGGGGYPASKSQIWNFYNNPITLDDNW